MKVYEIHYVYISPSNFYTEGEPSEDILTICAESSDTVVDEFYKCNPRYNPKSPLSGGYDICNILCLGEDSTC